MSTDPYDNEKSFLEKFGLAIAVGVFVLIAAGVGVGFYFFHGKIPPPKKPEEIMVKLLPPPPMPPPPPPPPPPKIPPPPEQKMVEQPKVQKPEPKPEAKVDKPPGPPGPKASGPPSDDGIGGAGGGGDGVGGGGGGGSKYGWYAAQVQARIADALRQNAKTRDVSLRLKVRIWSDASGRIVRAVLSGSSGDPAVDTAIRSEVLMGLQLQEPPPQDMPMPIVMMISAQRPT
jgi:outer membrane biosynthesis protein TonB